MASEPEWIAAKLRSELKREATVRGWTMPVGWENNVMIVVQRVLDEEDVGLVPGGGEARPIRLF